ncbi:hypothetical protein ACHAXT_012850 [Thalassiosira profunda]
MSSDGDDGEEGVGLYVHIPYCRRHCRYCDFAIVPIGSVDGDSKRAAGFENVDAQYKKAVLAEIDAISKSSADVIPLRSIYFGGGTPSLAPLSTLRDILDNLIGSENAPFRLMDDAEISIEMDPGTFDFDYLFAVKEMGFNRISLGVQSFDDTILETMGRVHRSADVYHSIDMLSQVFGEEANYSIDLISGVPGLTLAGWAATLYSAVRLQPQPKHMSLYDLQLEKGTKFGAWYGDGDEKDTDVSRQSRSGNSTAHPALPSAEDCAFMYSYASGYLRAKNYEHYEVSSYAYRDERGAQRSNHNQIYWEYGGTWCAVGLGATSNVNGVQYARPRALSDYISWAEGLEKNPPWLHNEPDASDAKQDALLDSVMTRLRTSDGLELDWVAREYGHSFVEAILCGFQLALDLDLGARDVTSGKYGRIRLKDPKGFLFSNTLISNVFLELSEMN